jgi:hypothetical protein
MIGNRRQKWPMKSLTGGMQMKTFDPQLTFAAAFSVAMTMSGCVTSDTGNKQLCGTLLGAGAGGLGSAPSSARAPASWPPRAQARWSAP